MLTEIPKSLHLMLAKLATVLHGKLLAVSIAAVVIIGGGTALAVTARSSALPGSHGAEAPTTTAHTDANDEHSDDQHELHGTVSTISSDSFVLKPTTGAPVTVTISSHTQFHDGLTGLSGLKAGDAVEVDGTLQSDGTFAATDVGASGNDENDADDTGYQGAKDLHGTVASIGANSFVLTVSGDSRDGDHSGHVGAKVTVTISTTTTFKNLSGLGALKVGEQVEVKGTLQAGGTLAASSVVATSQGNTSGGD
jgi:uncharacterized protein YdeI (BOF family)